MLAITLDLDDGSLKQPTGCDDPAYFPTVGQIFFFFHDDMMRSAIHNSNCNSKSLIHAGVLFELLLKLHADAEWRGITDNLGTSYCLCRRWEHILVTTLYGKGQMGAVHSSGLHRC